MARYRSNEPRFIDESVDGEALIMDMVTGTYYTCLGTSTVAWDALKGGVDTAQVAAVIASTYQVSLSQVEADLARFVAELLDEQMLVGWDGGGAQAEAADRPAPHQPVRAAPDGAGGTSIPYEPMRLERYDDLADLILLDPVHDVTGGARPHE